MPKRRVVGWGLQFRSAVSTEKNYKTLLCKHKSLQMVLCVVRQTPVNRSRLKEERRFLQWSSGDHACILGLTVEYGTY